MSFKHNLNNNNESFKQLHSHWIPLTCNIHHKCQKQSHMQTSCFYINMDLKCKQHPWCARKIDNSFCSDIERASHCKHEHLQNSYDECTIHPTHNLSLHIDSTPDLPWLCLSSSSSSPSTCKACIPFHSSTSSSSSMCVHARSYSHHRSVAQTT